MTNNKAKNEVSGSAKAMKVALFCIGSAVILYFGANFLKGLDTFGERTVYYSVFEDSGKIHPGSVIYANGFKIGKVSAVEMLPGNPITIVAEYLVTQEMNIPNDSKFSVVSDIMGGVSVQLLMGNSTNYAISGDTLECELAPSMLGDVANLTTQVSSVLSNVDTITFALKEAVYTSQNQENKITAIVDNMAKLTTDVNKMVADNKNEVSSIVNNLNRFTATLTKATPQLETIISNFENISDSLAKANITTLIANTNSTISEVETLVEKVNNGEGNAAMLLNDKELYTNLTATMGNLDKLLIDFKENPKKYINVTVFGRKEKKD